MNRTTNLVLFLLVALLGAAVGWQWLRERRSTEFRTVEPIFPGLDPARVKRIGIENLERALFVVMERDDEGRWQIVEPIEFPARAAYPSFLLQIAEHNELTPLAPAAGGEHDLAALKLEPPRAVVRYFEATAAGERVHTVELGAVDPDPSRMTVRVRERVWTTVRNLEATVDHPLDEYREPRILDLLPRNVVELHRSGTFEGADATLDALLDTGEWRLTRPLEARLDPEIVGHVVVTAALLEAVLFVDDVTRPLADFGLDPPELELTLVTVADERQTLRLGRDEEDRWHATRDGSRYVFVVEALKVGVLGLEARGLVDRTVVRATRDDLQAVALRRAGRELRIERVRNAWVVSEGGQSFPADTSSFRDLLAQIERLELGGPVDDEDALVGDAFEGPAGSGGDGFLLELRDGADQGGTFGPAFTLATGDEVRLFRRRGDSLVAWVDPRAAAIVDWKLEDLRSLNLMAGVIEEHQAFELQVATAAGERRYERDARGRWKVSGSALETHELVPVLDKLFFLRGERNLPGAGRPRLVDTVTVTIVDESGNALAIVFGHAPDAGGRLELELLGRRATPADPGLVETLRALVPHE